MPGETRRGDGLKLDPMEGAVPIVIRQSEDIHAVEGSGSWLTRYGLFVTAAHVFAGANDGERLTRDMFIPQPYGDDGLVLRRIQRVTLNWDLDVAIGEADNFKERFPHDPLRNLRPEFSSALPEAGTRLVTFAYPMNDLLDLGATATPAIAGDYFHGSMIGPGENPRLKGPHFDMEVEIESGASGAPVFHDHHVIGIASRGFGKPGDDEAPLATAVSAQVLLDLVVPWPLGIPAGSWEESQVPAAERGRDLSVRDLVDFGHVLWREPAA